MRYTDAVTVITSCLFLPRVYGCLENCVNLPSLTLSLVSYAIRLTWSHLFSHVPSSPSFASAQYKRFSCTTSDYALPLVTPCLTGAEFLTGYHIPYVWKKMGAKSVEGTRWRIVARSREGPLDRRRDMDGKRQKLIFFLLEYEEKKSPLTRNDLSGRFEWSQPRRASDSVIYDHRRVLCTHKSSICERLFRKTCSKILQPLEIYILAREYVCSVAIMKCQKLIRIICKWSKTLLRTLHACFANQFLMGYVSISYFETYLKTRITAQNQLQDFISRRS